jgi:hypothetical protein
MTCSAEGKVDMTCQGILIRFNNREICIPIYIEERSWRPPGPDLADRLFDDIRVLATINQGIAHISDRHVRDNLAQAVHQAARSMSLPEGVELGDGLFTREAATSA